MNAVMAKEDLRIRDIIHEYSLEWMNGSSLALRKTACVYRDLRASAASQIQLRRRPCPKDSGSIIKRGGKLPLLTSTT